MAEEINIPDPPVPVSPEKGPGPFRMILTLGVAGFLSGLVMAGTYLYTKPVIEANKALTTERAIFKVLPQCASFKTLELKNGALAEKQPREKKSSAKEEEPRLIFMGLDSAQHPVGFAVLGSEIGFADVITIMIGYDAVKKTIIGYEVLECKETPGLGDKIFKDAGFLKNFISLSTRPEIKLVKKGEKQNPNEVEAITGATISSKAVTRLLSQAINEWKGPIDNYINSKQQ